MIFDIDGTLVDSQRTIVTRMQAAFAAAGREPPTPEAIRRIVGLSLSHAVLVLLGGSDEPLALEIAAHYQRISHGELERAVRDPLFPGALALLDLLGERGCQLGVATGKNMRGLRLLLEGHGLIDRFVTLQTADLHPSKPHPAMVVAAMAEAGCRPGETMMVGDTTFDILMARAAGAMAVGVPWGNHPVHELEAAGAHHIIESFDRLPDLLSPFHGS